MSRPWRNKPFTEADMAKLLTEQPQSVLELARRAKHSVHFIAPILIRMVESRQARTTRIQEDYIELPAFSLSMREVMRKRIEAEFSESA